MDENKEELSTQITALTTIIKSTLDVQELKHLLNKLTILINKQNVFLPKFNQELNNSLLKNLQSRLKQDSRAFKFVRNPVLVSPTTITPITPTRSFIDTENSLKNMVNQKLSTLLNSIENCSNCIITINSCGALYLTNISNSIIISTTLSSSILAHNLSNCLVLASCQQFRIHDSINSTLWLDIPSNPIIEDSSKLVFCPFGKSSNNLFHQVLDFKWLQGGQSPNWAIGDLVFKSIDHIPDGVVHDDVLNELLNVC